MEPMVSFGYWLRRRRKALDLTQAELAQRAGCAKATIQKIELDERRPSREMAVQLAHVLAIPPEEQATFLQCARGELLADRLPGQMADVRVPVVVQAPARRPGNVPSPPTALIGRAPEVAAVCLLVQRPDVRLVTLTGVGGTGKTRLAFQVAADLQSDFADGVAIVELAPLSDPRLAGETIARTLGVQEAGGQDVVAQLTAYLRTKHALLVLDNFEHLLAAAPLVAELLRAAPRLTVLVTSRAVLHLSGEHEFPVPPLKLPDPGLPLDALAENEAVRLFVARAQAATPTFQLTAGNAAEIAALCRHLEGLPLAIELAAVRTKLFPPALLLRRLEHRLAELTGGPRDAPRRQQTLRQTVDWSYHLLTPAEQVLFRRLAVFVGGWRLEAAEAVCGGDDLDLDVLGGLQALVDQSLIQVAAGPESVPRFTMLETLREYALERLVAGDELEPLRARHARYFRALAAPLALLHEGERVVASALDADYDNLRTVLEWARKRGEAAIGLEVACALIDYWAHHGAARERQQWLETFLDLSAAMESSADARIILLRVYALMEAGELARQLGQLPHAMALLQHSHDLARAQGDERGAAWAIFSLGIATWNLGDQAGGVALLEEALRAFRAAGDRYAVASILFPLARLGYARSDPARATAYLEESLQVWRVSGDQMSIGRTLEGLAEVAILQGQSQRAITLLEESLAVSRERGERRWVGEALHNLARLVLEAGDWSRAAALLRESLEIERRINATAAARRFLEDSVGIAMARGAWAVAARLLGAVETAREQSASNTQSVVETPYVGRADEVRDHLGANAFAAAWAEGRAMAVEQAVAYALEQLA